MEAALAGLFILVIVVSIVSFVWGIGEAVFRTFRGDRTPALRRAYRYEDSAGVDSGDAGE